MSDTPEHQGAETEKGFGTGLRAQLQRRRGRRLRLRRGLVAVAPRLQLGPETRAESLLDFVFAGCH